MSTLENLIHNYAVFIPILFIVCVMALESGRFLWNLLEDIFIEKLGLETKWSTAKKQEHKLLIETVKKINELSERHYTDMELCAEKDDKIEKLLSDFIQESSATNKHIVQDLENAVTQISKSIEKINNENIEHWETSKNIRTNINSRLSKVVDSNEERDDLIRAIAEGSKELLGDKIDQKFEKYVKLDGIPINEVDEFESLCKAYFGLKGNHNRKARYEHVKMNMKIIPVKTELDAYE